MKFLSALLVALLINSININQSFALPKYSQTRNKTQQQTNSATTRGCRDFGQQTLQLLAPSNRIVSIGSEKTFLLNINQLPTYPLQLSILEPLEPEAVWKKQIKIKSIGLTKITLPQTLVLKPYTDYIFTAKIPCDPNIPSRSIYVRAIFQKSSLDYGKQLSIKELIDKGIWYDALWIAYKNNKLEFEELLEKQNIELEK